jgi:NAD-dependent DNA ligase
MIFSQPPVKGFQNLRAVTAATPDEFSLISGLGPIKVQRLYDAFHQPFSSKLSRQRKQQQQQPTIQQIMFIVMKTALLFISVSVSQSWYVES